MQKIRWLFIVLGIVVALAVALQNNEPTEIRLLWLVQTMPFREELNAFRQIDFSVGVYHPNNLKVRKLSPDLLRCPSSTNSPRRKMSQTI